MNPARSTGAAIVSSFYSSHTAASSAAHSPIQSLWVFWVIPFLASALVGLVFIIIKLIASIKDRKEDTTETFDENSLWKSAFDESDDSDDSDTFSDSNTLKEKSSDRLGSVSTKASSDSKDKTTK